ncbi:MAG: hypothetical protein WKG06_46820 [Segetibacter sp.]
MKKLLHGSSLLFAFIFVITFLIKANAAPAAKDTRYFQLKVYHYTSSQQEAIIDNYLQSRFIPSLHASGVSNIGVFKAIANDTAADKKMYVFIPFASLKQWEKYSGSRQIINQQMHLMNILILPMINLRLQELKIFF